jgi:hypothetical protein
MRKNLIVAGYVVLSVLTTAPGAHAAEWKCGLVSIELKKNMVHDYTLTIDGPLQVNPIRAKVKELRDGTITFNGTKCNRVEREDK